MLTLSSPSGLWGLLTLGVPLALFLWNRRPGRRVAVGSVRWLATGANQRWRRLHPRQLLVFLLRTAVLVLLVLAGAGLQWQAPAPPPRGQLLIGPDLLTSPSLAAIRPALDSLRRRGYTTRLLQAGWPHITEATWARLDSGLAPAVRWSGPPAAAWQLVQQAADSLPGQPLYIFTSAMLPQFGGIRPVLPKRVRWQLVPTPDSSRWLQAAFRRSPDSLRLLLGRSTDAQVSFRSVWVGMAGGQVRVPGLGRWRYRAGAGGGSLVSAADTVLVREKPRRAWVCVDAAFAPDARYLQAALRAAALGLDAPLRLTVADRAPAAAEPAPDWLFWLSRSPVPARVQQQVADGMQLWLFPTDAGQPRPGWFAPLPDGPVVPLRRAGRPPADSAAQLTIWAGPGGTPMLSRTTRGRGQIYRMHTRLQPAWSGLGNTAELPELLLPLLQPPVTAPARYDRRALPASQLLPLSQAPESAGRPAPAVPAQPLLPWLVLLATALFGLERVIAYRAARLNASPSTA